MFYLFYNLIKGKSTRLFFSIKVFYEHILSYLSNLLIFLVIYYYSNSKLKPIFYYSKTKYVACS